jgi:hypothetical protein
MAIATGTLLSCDPLSIYNDIGGIHQPIALATVFGFFG